MTFRSIFRAATCGLLALASGPALAAAQGYWALSQAPDGIKLGVIFPDFSPNEFAGLGFVCTPGVETVQGWSDVGRALKGGAKVSVAIDVDGAATRYGAKAERSEMDDSVRANFMTTLGDPLFADLAKAKTLKVSVGAATSSLPTRGAAATFADFLAKCRAGGE